MSLLLTLGLGGSSTPPTPPSGGDTPYMNLLLPTVSVTLGPLYATEVNGAFLRVDAHDHTSGYGKPVPSAGLNINADLPFNGFSAINMKTAGFAIQSATVGPVGTIYFSGQDFYVIDGTGTPIQITAAGAVNVSGLGSWTGLVSPAQAGYSSVSKKFTLLSNTSGPKYGLLAVGDILLYPADPSTSGIYTRLKAAGVATYTMTLPPNVPSGVGNAAIMQLNNDGTVTLGPSLPSPAPAFLRVGATGSLAADVTVGTALDLAGSGPYTLEVTAQGITTVQLANGAVHEVQRQAVNASGGTQYASAQINTTVDNGTGAVVVAGPFNFTPNGLALNARPIRVCLAIDPSVASSEAYFNGTICDFTISTQIDSSGGSFPTASQRIRLYQSNSQYLAPGSLFDYVIPAGTITSGVAHTFQLTVAPTPGGANNGHLTLIARFTVQEL